MSGVLKVKVGGVWTPVSATAGPHHASHEPGGSDALQFSTGILERGRTVPLGEWTDVPYSAANFQGSSGMSWTVDASDVVTFRYTLIGKTAVVILNLQATTVGGTPAAGLYVSLPFTPLVYTSAMFWGLDNGVWMVGAFQTVTGDPRIALYRSDAAPWAVSSGNTYVTGQLVVSI